MSSVQSTTICDPKIKSRIKMLNQEFYQAFKPGAMGREWLIPSIKRSIKIYRLHGIDAWEVVTEAYLRASRFVETGGLIWNLVSWLKSASVRILCEYQRKTKSLDVVYLPNANSLRHASTYLQENIPSGLETDISEIVDIFVSFLKELKSSDQELILWSLMDGLSWADIRKKLEERGELPPTESTLRQRKHRAVMRLRKKVLHPRFKILFHWIFSEESDLFRHTLRLAMASAVID